MKHNDAIILVNNSSNLLTRYAKYNNNFYSITAKVYKSTDNLGV